MSAEIPLFSLVLSDEVLPAIARVVESRWLTMGPETQAFEAEFAALHGVPAEQAIAVNSGTAALHLALAGLGVGPGDEVIVPSLTFVATANAVRYVGATPVFADIVGPHDLTIDVDHVARLIGPKTKAVIPVHYAGYNAHMTALNALCAEHGVAVVEDAAHSPAVCTQEGALGTLGDVGCFSFFSNKNLAIGEGGMVICMDADKAPSIRHMRSHGMTHSTLDRDRGHAFSYDVVNQGYNYRIDEIRAAIGRCQMKSVIKDNAIRKEKVDTYHRLLNEHAVPQGVLVPFADRDPCTSAFHIMPIVLPDGAPRNEIMAALRSAGIQTSIHYPPIHWFTDFKQTMSTPARELERTESVAYRLLTLPLFPTMTDAMIKKVVHSLVTALN